jgi:hypothetical protein
MARIEQFPAKHGARFWTRRAPGAAIATLLPAGFRAGLRHFSRRRT